MASIKKKRTKLFVSRWFALLSWKFASAEADFETEETEFFSDDGRLFLALSLSNFK